MLFVVIVYVGTHVGLKYGAFLGSYGKSTFITGFRLKNHALNAVPKPILSIFWFVLFHQLYTDISVKVLCSQATLTMHHYQVFGTWKDMIIAMLPILVDSEQIY
jgi:ABC-type phosphate transport system permease subunit